MIKEDINDREKLNKLGYNSKIYYCGNYSMEKYYSYVYNKLKALGVNFALNRACFIHDVNYGLLKKEILKSELLNKIKESKGIKKYWYISKLFVSKFIDKLKIDKHFYNDMQRCIIYEYQQRNISFKHAAHLRFVAGVFYGIVIIATPFYIYQKL